MKLYFSFGYVDEDNKSVRLYHMEQPLDVKSLGGLMSSIKSLLGAAL